MSAVNIIACTIAFAVGFAAGCWFYRYTLRNNPEKLEAWARQIKLAREAAVEKAKRR